MSTHRHASPDSPTTSRGSRRVAQTRRTGLDLLVGVILIGAGVFILGDVVVATVISVLLLGWTALCSGVVMLIGALMRIRSGGSWLAALGGAMLTVLGLFILRNPTIGALSLTLLAGSLFLATGVTRIFTSGHFRRDRWIVVLSGLVSVGLGLFVVFNLVTATPKLLGILLGAQMLIEGMTLLIAGRVHYVQTDEPGSPG